MKHRTQTHSLIPLILLSFTLACSSLQPSFGYLPSFAKDHKSQKEAAIDQVFGFDLPAMKPYIHSAGIFSFDAPVGWQIENTQSGIMLHSPASVVFSASVIRTGYKISSLSFIDLASNAENTKFGYQDKYEEVYRREDRLNRYILIEKEYTLKDVRKLVSTIYKQIDESIYVIEMTGNRVEIMSNSDYAALFLNFAKSIQDRQSEMKQTSPYMDSWIYNEPDLFSMEVPLGWKLLTDNSEENIINIQFRSPDDNAIIESIFWDYDTTVELNVAAKYALEIIGTSYAKDRDDIKVTSETILEDGKQERITWVSRSGEYSGILLFEVRNETQIFILSQVWNRLFQDIYSPITASALETFSLYPMMK